MNKNILIGIGGIVVFPSPYGVSFILILSDNDINCYCEEASFRLLTEYHSFLCCKMLNIKENGIIGEFPSPYGVSFILILKELKKFLDENMIYSGFRLLTEYHSFLSFSLYNLTFRLYLLFPSPYGVSFILM